MEKKNNNQNGCYSLYLMLHFVICIIICTLMFEMLVTSSLQKFQNRLKPIILKYDYQQNDISNLKKSLVEINQALQESDFNPESHNIMDYQTQIEELERQQKHLEDNLQGIEEQIYKLQGEVLAFDEKQEEDENQNQRNVKKLQKVQETFEIEVEDKIEKIKKNEINLALARQK